jgi:hypothetical protein
MRFDNIPREAWIGLVILFILATQNAGFFGLLFLVGMLYFVRSIMEGGTNTTYSQSRRPQRYDDYRSDVYTPSYEEPVIEEPEIDHVEEAIRTAGHDPNTLQVLPIDLGVMVYKDNNQPQIYRMDAVPDDVDYVRPFVELELPSAVSGRIKFEILDSTGKSLFVDENSYQLKRGTQPIIAQTWLPVHDAHDLEGMWQLRVSADGVLLANHTFEWDREQNPAAIRRHIEEDGEVSAELRQAIAQSRLEKMSLDELLSDQDESQPPRQQRRS